jgi:hypothetical protein
MCWTKGKPRPTPSKPVLQACLNISPPSTSKLPLRQKRCLEIAPGLAMLVLVGQTRIDRRGQQCIAISPRGVARDDLVRSSTHDDIGKGPKDR